MYAVIKTGGKQYRVQEGDVIDVELLNTDESGQYTFEDVLMVRTEGDVLVGAPRVTGWTVSGEVLGQIRGPKVYAFKYKRRKNYRRKKGHRQDYNRVRITGIAEQGK